MEIDKRKRCNIMRAQLDVELQSVLPQYRDIAQYIRTTRTEFTPSDRTRRDRRNSSIYDNTATISSRTLASGMQSGITPKSRPWFKLSTPDAELAEWGPAKEWLHDVQLILATSLLKSNAYKNFPVGYQDLADFGTSAMSMEKVYDGSVMHTASIPVGSFRIGKDWRGRVNTLLRDYSMTVGQLVECFGVYKNGKPDWSMFSTAVKSAYDNSNYNTWIDVVHLVAPDPDYHPSNPFTNQWMSVNYELGVNEKQKFLRESSFNYFPYLVPRWSVTGGHVFGSSCPGMDCLGDVKQLQYGEKKVAQAIEKMINPPMNAPTAMRNSTASILPSDINYIDVREGQQGFKPVYELQFNIDPMERKQEQVRKRIRDTYFEPLFLMFSGDERNDRATATEIAARQEEKLIALGPVLEHVDVDQNDPLIDTLFQFHLEMHMLPPPPQELEGMGLKVEYISIMAQAQKMIGIGSYERFSANLTQLMAIDPMVSKKVKIEELADAFADSLSISPKIIRTDEEYAQIVQAMQQQQQEQHQAEMMQQGSQAAKNLGQAPIADDNALGGLIDMAKTQQMG